jgi:hypothetical protein
MSSAAWCHFELRCTNIPLLPQMIPETSQLHASSLPGARCESTIASRLLCLPSAARWSGWRYHTGSCWRRCWQQGEPPRPQPAETQHGFIVQATSPGQEHQAERFDALWNPAIGNAHMTSDGSSMHVAAILQMTAAVEVAHVPGPSAEQPSLRSQRFRSGRRQRPEDEAMAIRDIGLKSYCAPSGF